MLKNPKYKTQEFDIPAYSRKGFVNMIQATDALLARCIVVKLEQLGCEYITAIHDCFRVDVHSMAKLEKAIKMSYNELFSGDSSLPTNKFPKGLDILGLYFEGAEDALKPEYQGTIKPVSQFIKNKEMRRLYKVDGYTTKELVDKLGETYYFAK